METKVPGKIDCTTPDKLIGPLNDVEKKYAPEFLYYRGRKLVINNPRVSVIGTRKPTQQGVKNAQKLARFLVKNGIVVVSGLAHGIDTVAHITTLESKGKTIAVLGTPLDKYYPAQNRKLQNELMKNHLVISQFTSGSPVHRGNFPSRNRTMALLSHASIIVEAGERSGTYHQGWEALRLGRRLFIVEDMVKEHKYEWTTDLIKYGAEVLSMNDMDAILDSLPMRTINPKTSSF